jgi:hypothetical protein
LDVAAPGTPPGRRGRKTAIEFRIAVEFRRSLVELVGRRRAQVPHGSDHRGLGIADRSDHRVPPYR